MPAIGSPMKGIGDGWGRLQCWMGSMTGRLVATAVVLVAVVSVLIGAATATALHAYLLGQLDENVGHSQGPAMDELGLRDDHAGSRPGSGGSDGDDAGRHFQGEGPLAAFLPATPQGEATVYM